MPNSIGCVPFYLQSLRRIQLVKPLVVQFEEIFSQVSMIPKHVHSFVNGMKHFNKGNFELALEHFEKATSNMAESEEEIPPAQAAMTYCYKAMSLISLKNWNAVLAASSRGLELEKTIPKLWFCQSLAWENLQDFSAALVSAETGLDNTDQNWNFEDQGLFGGRFRFRCFVELWGRKAFAYIKLGKFKLGLEAAQNGLKFEKTLDLVEAKLLALLRLERFNECVVAADAALQHWPTSVELWKSKTVSHGQLMQLNDALLSASEGLKHDLSLIHI